MSKGLYLLKRVGGIVLATLISAVFWLPLLWVIGTFWVDVYGRVR